LNGKLTDFKSKLIETIKWCENSNNKDLKFFNDDGTSDMEVWSDNSGTLEKIKGDAEKDLKLVKDRLSDIKVELKTLIVDVKSIKKIEKNFIKKYKNGRPNEYHGVKLVNNLNK
jgi:hypothetical protein